MGLTNTILLAINYAWSLQHMFAANLLQNACYIYAY